MRFEKIIAIHPLSLPVTLQTVTRWVDMASSTRSEPPPFRRSMCRILQRARRRLSADP
jgi:hypothetical protein